MTGYPYQYVVLRLVPRVERQEFVNVGVVVYAQEAAFIDGAFHLDACQLKFSGGKSFSAHLVLQPLDADPVQL